MRQATGPDVLDRLGGRLDDLLAAAGAPVTARRPWLSAWAAAFPHTEPWVVWVPGCDDRDTMDAAALLARSRRFGATLVSGLGHGTSDRGVSFPARNAAAATALADAVAGALRALPGPWALVVEQQPAADPVPALLAARLRVARVSAGDGCPVLRIDARATRRRTPPRRRAATCARRASGWPPRGGACP